MLAVAAAALSLAAAGTSETGHRAVSSSDAGLIVFSAYWPTSLAAANTLGDHTSVICGVDLHGHTYRLTAPSAGDEQEQPSWSPDGLRLAVVNGPVTGTRPPNFAIWQLGQNKRIVRRGAADSEWPSWAPLGNEIAYQTPADGTGGTAQAIWVANADGAAPRRLISGRGRAAWAPDASMFALPSSNGIAIVGVDGATKQTLLPGTHVPWVDWSPSNSWLVFQTGLSTEGEFQLIAPDGSRQRPVRAHLGGFTPTWSPLGQLIAYQTNNAIRVVRADGTGARLLYSTLLTPDGGLDWQPVPHPALLKRLPPCVIAGSRTNHRLIGSEFGDVMLGLFRGDSIFGRGGNDLIIGSGGNDRIFGDSGADQIAGGAGADRIDGGSGKDVLYGGPGNDTIYARDGQRDTISCGPGRDTVYADRVDAVAKDCERVLRAPK